MIDTALSAEATEVTSAIANAACTMLSQRSRAFARWRRCDLRSQGRGSWRGGAVGQDDAGMCGGRMMPGCAVTREACV